MSSSALFPSGNSRQVNEVWPYQSASHTALTVAAPRRRHGAPQQRHHSRVQSPGQSSLAEVLYFEFAKAITLLILPALPAYGHCPRAVPGTQLTDSVIFTDLRLFTSGARIANTGVSILKGLYGQRLGNTLLGRDRLPC